MKSPNACLNAIQRFLACHLSIMLTLGTGLFGCDKEEDESPQTEEKPKTPKSQTQPASSTTAPSGSSATGTDDDVAENEEDSENGSASQATGEAISITAELRFPTLTRNVLVADEVVVDISHDGSSAECSSDDGATFTACTFATFSAAGVDTRHVVRVYLDGADNSPLDLTFTPSSEFPDETFVDCDETIGSNLTFDAFEALIAYNTVICLEDGVTIYNSDTEAQDEIEISDHLVTVIARQGDTATISGSRTSGSDRVFEISGNGSQIVGIDFTGTNNDVLNITSPGGGKLEDIAVTLDTSMNGKAAVRFSGSAGFSVSGLEIDVTSQGVFNRGLVLSDGTTVNKIERLDLVANGSGAAMQLDNGVVYAIRDSYIEGANYRAIETTDANGQFQYNIYDSVVRCGDTSQRCMNYDVNSNGGLAVFENTVIQVMDDQAEVFYLSGSVKPNLYTLSFDGVTFALSAGVSSDVELIEVTNDSSEDEHVNSNLNDNIFCRATASHTFNPIYTGTAQTHFDPADQQNGGAVVTCAAGVF